MTKTTLNASLSWLHPKARKQFDLLAMDVMPGFRIFEGFRDPGRQQALMMDPRGVTKAGAWRSAHQYGLACDFVPWIGGRWAWPLAEASIWDELKAAAELHGLEAPLKWDRAHIQHPLWNELKPLLL
jgi:hypothetical protein